MGFYRGSVTRSARPPSEPWLLPLQLGDTRQPQSGNQDGTHPGTVSPQTQRCRGGGCDGCGCHGGQGSRGSYCSIGLFPALR